MDNKNLNEPENTQKTDSIDVKENINNNTTESKKTVKQQKRKQKKELKTQKIEAKNLIKAKKIEERQRKNTRWFWFFILLLLAIIALFLLDNHKKQNIYERQVILLDSIEKKESFFKTKYEQSDSSMNLLLSSYNNLLRENIDNSVELSSNKSELLKLQKIIYLQDSILRQVKTSIDLALSDYSTDEVAVEMRDGKLYITMRNKLLFPSGSSLIQSKGINALNSIAKVLIENSNIDLVVEGHTDNVPLSSKSDKYSDNWDLSTDRAVSVTRLLVDKYNIRPERITAAGRSMFFPIAPNTTSAGRAKNRRIEIILTPNLNELYNLADESINLQ